MGMFAALSSSCRGWPETGTIGPPTVIHTKKPKKPKKGRGGITDPTDIAGLTLWLDGSDSSTMNQTSGSQPWGAGTGGVQAAPSNLLGNWEDKSGSDNHLNNSNSGNRPAWIENIQNGLSVVRFSESVIPDFLYSTASFLSDPDTAYTIICVLASTNDEDLGILYCNVDSATSRVQLEVDTRSGSERCIRVEGATDVDTALLPSDIGTEFNLITAINDAGLLTARLNGVAGTSVQVTGDVSTANDYTRLGNNRNDTTHFEGDVGLFVVYDRALTPTEINQVEVWAQAFWATPALP